MKTITIILLCIVMLGVVIGAGTSLISIDSKQLDAIKKDYNLKDLSIVSTKDCSYTDYCTISFKQEGLIDDFVTIKKQYCTERMNYTETKKRDCITWETRTDAEIDALADVWLVNRLEGIDTSSTKSSAEPTTKIIEVGAK